MVHGHNSSPQVHKDRRDWHNIKKMLPYLWEFRGRVVFALCCLVLAKTANVGVPLALKEIVDVLDQEQQLIALPVMLLLGYGVLKLLSSFFNEMRDVIFARVRYRAMRRLSSQVLGHLHDLSLRFHLERQTGAISRDLERGTRSVCQILNYMAFSVLPIVVEFALVAIILLTQYDLVFSLITFGTVVVYLLVTFAITEWRMDFRHHMNQLDSRANSQAIDSLMNYETVKYFGNEPLELDQFDKTQQEWEQWAVKTQTSMSALNFAQGAVISAGVTLIMFFAAYGVTDGSMSIGDLVLVNAFLLQLFIPLGFLGIVYRQIKYSLADMDLIFKLLEKAPEVVDRPGASGLEVTQGEVSFSKVDFYYQPERQILKDVDFSIPPGHKVAIVGPSGAGKSTLARLLYRFYDITGGMIAIDDQDIREVTQQSLRNAISIVPQDTVLFNNSIYYNIAYGRLGSTREEVEEAAELAQLSQFIDSLPDGWDTLVGERGLKLSGGEKQRVAIARAMLKKPRILVFDEATSSLDSKTEKAIQDTLSRVARDHTTLVIAHRLSTVVDADQILVMEGGVIKERGTHGELLAKKGMYTEMWELQKKEQAQEDLLAESQLLGA